MSGPIPRHVAGWRVFRLHAPHRFIEYIYAIDPPEQNSRMSLFLFHMFFSGTGQR